MKYFICFLIFFSNPQHSHCAPKSIIIQDEVMLRVDTHDPGNTIQLIQLFDEQNNCVLSHAGCQQSICKLNLGVLPSGSYLVMVDTSTGAVLSSTVCLQ
ncbi:MAG: hypothetical protein AAFV25_12720 [Bacteroidota bacterium]